MRSAAKPGKFAYVQADTLWSESERKHLRPGHGWLCELGDAGGDKGCFEEMFKLPERSWKQYEGMRFYDGEAALVINPLPFLIGLEPIRVLRASLTAL